jgi:osmotically-inducible protein OsmY
VEVEDFRINAQVRALLVRRWVDTSKVDQGTTNGVVYFRGTIRSYRAQNMYSKQEAHEAAAYLVARIERDIRGIRGVKDVVMDLEDFKKVGGRWRQVAHI